MPAARHPVFVPSAPLRRMVVLLLGVVLVVRALMLPPDLPGHAGQHAGGASATLPALQTSVGVAEALAPSEALARVLSVSVSDASGGPSCHDSHAAAPERSTSADLSVCQILCAVACAPLLLPMPFNVAHHGGERRHERAPMLPDGIVMAPEHRPPIA